MSPWLPQVLPPVWSTLTSSAAKYVREVVNVSGEEEEVVDSDGEVLGFENLVFAIFEFVHALVETPKFRGAIKAGLADLMYYIVLYMQITEDQVKKIYQNLYHVKFPSFSITVFFPTISFFLFLSVKSGPITQRLSWKMKTKIALLTA